MSADNQITVVKFADNTFSVSHTGCIDEKDDLEFYLRAMNKDFSQNTFKTQEEAIDFARKLEEEEEDGGGYIEYGINYYEVDGVLADYATGTGLDSL